MGLVEVFTGAVAWFGHPAGYSNLMTTALATSCNVPAVWLGPFCCRSRRRRSSCVFGEVALNHEQTGPVSHKSFLGARELESDPHHTFDQSIDRSRALHRPRFSRKERRQSKRNGTRKSSQCRFKAPFPLSRGKKLGMLR